MRPAQPETRQMAVEALQRAMMDAKNNPAKYGLYGDDRKQYQADQAKRIQIVKARG